MHDPYANTQGVFGEKMLKALGLEGRSIKSITIHVTGNSVPQVRIVENLCESQGHNIIQVVKRFKLEPI